MSRVGPTVILLDVDGVLNFFDPELDGPVAAAEVGRWIIRWRPDVLDLLKAVLALPEVEGGWLTSWLETPWLLDDLEQQLGLNGLVPHRAGHPAIQTKTSGTVIDERFDEQISFSPVSRRWWKLRAAELLVHRLSAMRLAWFDDELPLANGRGEGPVLLSRPSDQLLVRPEPMVGLTMADMSRLLAWIMTTGASDGTVTLHAQECRGISQATGAPQKPLRPAIRSSCSSDGSQFCCPHLRCHVPASCYPPSADLTHADSFWESPLVAWAHAEL